MTVKILAACLAQVAGAVGDEPPTVELNGGMQGQLLSLGRRNYVLTAAVKITDKGQDHVLLLLFGAPSAVDDASVGFELPQAVNGVAFCRGPNINPRAPRLCVGLPKVDDENLFPLQGYTEFAARSLDAPSVVQPPGQTADTHTL
jgi:hypothetical protein